jgi:hypothetical protein
MRIHEKQESAFSSDLVLRCLNAILSLNSLANKEMHVDGRVISEFDRGDKSTFAGAPFSTCWLIWLGCLGTTAFPEFNDLFIACE